MSRSVERLLQPSVPGTEYGSCHRDKVGDRIGEEASFLSDDGKNVDDDADCDEDEE